jgi:hypothetical protein
MLVFLDEVRCGRKRHLKAAVGGEQMNFFCVSERGEGLKMADNSLMLFSIFIGIGMTFIEMEEAVRVKLRERKKIFLVGSCFTRERERERMGANFGKIKSQFSKSC